MSPNTYPHTETLTFKVHRIVQTRWTNLFRYENWRQALRIMMILLCNKHFCVSSLQNWHSFFLLSFFLSFSFQKKSSSFPFPLCKCNITSGSKNYSPHIKNEKNSVVQPLLWSKKKPNRVNCTCPTLLPAIRKIQIVVTFTFECIVVTNDQCLRFINEKRAHRV